MPTWAAARWSACPLRKPSAAGRKPRTQWPIVHAVLHGVGQNQLMARHKANHVNVAYAPTAEMADKALATKAAMLAELGVAVHLCGVATGLMIRLSCASHGRRAATISSVVRTRPIRGKMRSMELAWLSALVPVIASEAKTSS